MPTFKNVTTATITLYKIEEVALYQAELISTNGNIFHPYDINTDLYFRVLLNNEDITDKFTDIEWVRYSQDSDIILEDQYWGSKYHGESSISITRDDVNRKCIIQANAYQEINRTRTCVASARITLIDINELYSNALPPEDPKEGTLWVNTATNPPVIYSWNSTFNKWTEVGKTTPFVRNLIQNSNFWRLNIEGFIEDNSESLEPIRVHNINNKEWAMLKSKHVTNKDISAGIFQTTTYPLVKDSDYCLSFLAYKKRTVGYDGKNIYCKIVSVDIDNNHEAILATTIPIKTEQEVQISIPFKTMNNTEKLKCFIGVEPEEACDYYITQLSLYNTKGYYPWELSPEDVQLQLENKIDNDHMSVFNALTRNGTMEGIFIREDEDGNEHYYFNASHLKTGSIDGGLINGIGLNIKDDATGESIFHVYKDESGTHIDMIANNLYIGTQAASTVNYVNTSMNSAVTSAVTTSESYTNGQIQALNEVVDTKADNTSVLALEERIVDIESNTGEDAIVGTVTGSLAYIQMQNAINNKFKEHKDFIDDINSDIDDIEKDITNNIKPVIISSNIVSTVRNSNDYKNDLNNKVSTSSFEAHKNDMNNYLNTTFSTINNAINKKANEEKVSGIDSRVKTLESNTSASNIVSTVRNSNDYKNDLNKKVSTDSFDTYRNDMSSYLSTTFSTVNNNINKKADKNKIISTINSSTESYLISKEKVEFPTEYYLDTIYTGNNIKIKNPNKKPGTLTLDTIVDNIDFETTGLKLTMNIDNIKETDYVTVLDNANIYMNNNEIIKLLLYEIQQLKIRISELENNN